MGRCGHCTSKSCEENRLTIQYAVARVALQIPEHFYAGDLCDKEIIYTKRMQCHALPLSIHLSYTVNRWTSYKN